METYGKILLWAMPAFLILVLLEKWYGLRKGNDTVHPMDMISSLSSGVTNVTKDVLGLSLIIISYPFLLKHLAIVHIPDGWLAYLAAFICLDLAGYWVHRISHEYNLFWNNHIIHHSSEEFNLACALRQSISGIVRLFAIFLLPAALLGVPATVISIVAPLHLFAQFWYHTRHIGKLGILEKIIVTPSHHRVHHAINKEYIDKNYGQIFILWDKWFGSFQEELPQISPIYGVTRPVHTWNPVKINFMHLWLLILDAWRTASFKDKLRIWFMPTGWRPLDVAVKYPVPKIDDIYHFEKYAPPYSRALLVWSYIQLSILLLFISYLFGNIAAINHLHPFYIYLYGLFIFLYVYALTELMDRSPYAFIWELIKNLLGLAIVYVQQDWFAASSIWRGIPLLVAAYCCFASLYAGWLNYQQIKEDRRWSVS
jgi:sterol desaturase/sphingolipid hydroxylase (fatty acid hydroxylase superfamily)